VIQALWAYLQEKAQGAALKKNEKAELAELEDEADL
jgi:hypothetical protein